ncbi:MAG: YncE family protein [Myxococcales bacterium]|nr:YncE family protein [Myxococcales bacterium]
MRRPRAALLAPLVALLGCDAGISFQGDGGSWAAAPVPPWARQARLVITDNGDDTLAFVSLDRPTPRLLAIVPVGNIPIELEGPHHLAASPDGAAIFVGLSNYVPGSGSGPHGAHGTGTVPGSLIKLRASDRVQLGEAQVDRSPGDVVIASDGKTAFVSHYDLLRLQAQVTKGQPEEMGFSTVAVIDTATMARPPLYPVCATGHGMALSGDEKTLYVACSQVDQLAIMDLATHEVKRVRVGPDQRPPLDPKYGPYTVTRCPADGTLWISCNNSGDVRVYDPKKGAMDDARKVFVNGVPMFSAFLSDGRTLIVPHQGDEKISIIDTVTSKETAVISLPEPVCLKAHAILVMPDDQTAYLVCEGDHVERPGTLVALDLKARAVLGHVEVGLFPDGIALLPAAP